MVNYMYINGIALPPPASLSLTKQKIYNYQMYTNDGTLQSSYKTDKCIYTVKWDKSCPEYVDYVFKTLELIKDVSLFKIPYPGTDEFYKFNGLVDNIYTEVLTVRRINDAIKTKWTGLCATITEA